jgi:glycine cleavage system H protein
MTTIRGCDLPEDLYYYPDKHIWVKPMRNNLVRVGMNAIAAKLTGGKLTAVTVSARKVGKEIAQGKSVATVESSKFVGPVPAPVTGVLVRGNDQVAADPNLTLSDPYGEGWIAEVQASDWENEKNSLLSGPDGLAEYQARLEADNISCE